MKKPFENVPKDFSFQITEAKLQEFYEKFDNTLELYTKLQENADDAESTFKSIVESVEPEELESHELLVDSTEEAAEEPEELDEGDKNETKCKKFKKFAKKPRDHINYGSVTKKFELPVIQSHETEEYEKDGASLLTAASTAVSVLLLMTM